MKLDFETFEDFWPYYVHEHQDPTNRALHYIGTSMAIGTVAAAALTLNPAWLLAAPIVGYGPFVMNSEDEIRTAVTDFNSGRFGDIPAA